MINSDLRFTVCQVNRDQSRIKVKMKLLQQLSSGSFKKLTLSFSVLSSLENSHILGFC